MAGEIVKYDGGELAKAAKKLDEALAVLKGRSLAPLPVPRPKSQLAAPRILTPEIVRERASPPALHATRIAASWNPPEVCPADLGDCLGEPRVCARTKHLWEAVYSRSAPGARYTYLRSSLAEGLQLSLIRPDQWGYAQSVVIPGQEICPHCGGYPLDGFAGAVNCPWCNTWVCFGKTSLLGIFHCHCGHRLDLKKGWSRPRR